MKLILIPALLFCITTGHCQFTENNTSQLPDPVTINQQFKKLSTDLNAADRKIKIDKTERWKFNGNKFLTGGLMMLSGAAKGLNETLEFNWHGFAAVFPKANPKGEKFPLSSSVLVMFTDQYHLDNFIHRGAMTAALVIKIGEGKKPFRHYLFDALYYTAAYQLGFGSVYYYFKSRMPE